MKNIKQIIKHTLLAILVIGATVLLCQTAMLAYQQKEEIVKSFSAAIATKPEAFTELYFQNNETIASKPKIITDFNAVPYSFSFSIHNMENKDMQYSYNVSMSGMANKALDIKTVFVKNDQTKTISETFYLPNVIPTATKVTVALINKNNQDISFWIGGSTK